MDRVQFERVSKRYVLGDRKNAREALAAAGRRVVGRKPPQAREIWSLRDVSLSVADGEAVGILGRNGAGKSTVLKLLTGITAPTSGVARTRGRVAALLEVGTGFHQELTGRENIFLNGVILGMSRREITRSFDMIVDFSGVERFLDTPVKHYSTGMYLRLAFAIAAHLEPDILVVDEILAVGDAEFQRKCLGRMDQAGREGRTIIFVSHDLESLSRLCSRSLWIEAGQVRASGPTTEMVRRYLASGLTSEVEGEALVRSGALTLRSVHVRSQNNPGVGPLMRTDPLDITVEFELTEEVPGLDLAINVTTRGGVRVLDEVLSDNGEQRFGAGRYRAHMGVPPVLNLGDFAVGVWFGTSHAELIDEPAAATFQLHGGDRRRPERVTVLDLPITVRPVRSDD